MGSSPVKGGILTRFVSKRGSSELGDSVECGASFEEVEPEDRGMDSCTSVHKEAMNFKSSVTFISRKLNWVECSCMEESWD